MAKLKALNLHISINVGGNVMDNPDDIVGYSENETIVLDFANESKLEEQLTQFPWVAEIIRPAIQLLNAKYEAKLATESKPKEKTTELKKKLKDLL